MLDHLMRIPYTCSFQIWASLQSTRVKNNQVSLEFPFSQRSLRQLLSEALINDCLLLRLKSFVGTFRTEDKSSLTLGEGSCIQEVLSFIGGETILANVGPNASHFDSRRYLYSNVPDALGKYQVYDVGWSFREKSLILGATLELRSNP